MAYKFFDKRTSCSGIKNETTSDQELAKELHKLIIRKAKKRKVRSPLYKIFGMLIFLIRN